MVTLRQGSRRFAGFRFAEQRGQVVLWLPMVELRSLMPASRRAASCMAQIAHRVWASPSGGSTLRMTAPT